MSLCEEEPGGWGKRCAGCRNGGSGGVKGISYNYTARCLLVITNRCYRQRLASDMMCENPATTVWGNFIF